MSSSMFDMALRAAEHECDQLAARCKDLESKLHKSEIALSECTQAVAMWKSRLHSAVALLRDLAWYTQEVGAKAVEAGDLLKSWGIDYQAEVVERPLPNCRNCGAPSTALTNGWCDGCMCIRV
jgi:hypothetical protein